MASTSRRSVGGRSGAGAPRSQSHGNKSSNTQPIFLRGLDRSICESWFEIEDENTSDRGLRVWVDRDLLASKHLRGTEWVCVSVVQPSTLQTPVDAQQQQKTRDLENNDGGKPASKIIAQITAWDEAPDARHAVLSSSLCMGLGFEGLIGGIVRIESAPAHIPISSIKGLKIYPFATSATRQKEGLQFGGETKTSRQAAEEKLKTIYGKGRETHNGILNGPLTDGLILPRLSKENGKTLWNGGLLRFDPLPGASGSENGMVKWLIGHEESVSIQVQQEVPNPYNDHTLAIGDGDPIPREPPMLVGSQGLISKLVSSLSHRSSVLLNGGIGSGKTSLAYFLASRLRREKFCHVTYFPCRKLLTDETRVSTIKETLKRVFMAASWGCRLGGSALVVLDDLDKLCPTETELQVGGENGRSRQISELVCSITHQHCGPDSGLVLLITSQNKDTLNSIIIGAHVVRDIVDIKAPDKQTRRQILQSLASGINDFQPNGFQTVDKPTLGTSSDETPWMDGSVSSSRPNSSDGPTGFVVSRDLDFLDIAGQTDGYMPGDLELLISRARSEALIRAVQGSSNPSFGLKIELGKSDFQQALKGFTPASLRNVTLQTSSTTFDSIGGLKSTRKILLETLQYPTTYAPIFAQCPLRLRSGLLLYGYPGCGKTLLASAVAGECGLNFISVKGPEILNKYIGASEKSVRDLFDRAEAAKPCVLFFDEFDSIAPKRGHDSTGVTDRVVNQLLTQMDGAEGLSGVYVLAATSRPDLIDPALLRPGRLDKSLPCDLPDLEDREDILQALSKNLQIKREILDYTNPARSLTEVARRTDGYSGADLQAVIYNAHLEAIHDILGDQNRDSQNGPKDGNRNNARIDKPSRSRELIQFRLGEEEDRLEVAERASSSGINRSKQVAEKAALQAKIDSIRSSKKKERERKVRTVTDLSTDKDKDSKSSQEKNNVRDDDKKTSDIEVVIDWKHIEASLATTKASISIQERRKLEGVYREFVVGRNGEMPSGQGSVEVGGRSSLM